MGGILIDADTILASLDKGQNSRQYHECSRRGYKYDNMVIYGTNGRLNYIT
jgi:hypothetical protein